jgi:hypothetical protein
LTVQASPTSAKNTAASAIGTRRFTARTPIHSASVQTAYSIPSGLTEAEMNTNIGASAGTAATAVCSIRRRPKISPASSQAASTDTGTHSADISRAPSSSSNRFPPDAAA